MRPVSAPATPSDPSPARTLATLASVVGFACVAGWFLAPAPAWIVAAASAWLLTLVAFVRVGRRGGRVPDVVWIWLAVGALLGLAFAVWMARVVWG